ncbi:MAG: thioredoxin family protein [Deltaproteobacteria bacterium]|nr:thioredoxin family protein [Deltaproteobacteria bacterium]
MKIQVLGPGCKRCDQLYDNVLLALRELDLSDKAELAQVKDIDVFAKYGVFVTPALVINDDVVSVGKLLSVSEIEDALKARV